MADRTSQLTLGFLARHPDVAAAVLEEQPAEAAGEFLAAIPARLGGPVLARMLPFHASRCLLEVDLDAAAGMVREMPEAAAATSLRQFPVTRRDALLERLPRRLAVAIRLLLGFPVTTAGAWMDPRPLLLSSGGIASAARESLARNESEIDRVAFIVNRDQRLEGRVRISQLLRAPDATPLAAITEAVPVTIAARDDLLELRAHDAWEESDPVPVLSRDGTVIGAMRHADVRRGLSALREEGSEIHGGLMSIVDGSWLGMAGLLEGLLRLLPAPRTPEPPEDVQ